MKNIQMVDLKTQYNNIKLEIDSAIKHVIDNTSFINGQEVTSFSNHLASYLGIKHVITCGNGTDALQIALMSLDLKPNDEIIVPAFTFIASAEVIGLLGYRPVMVDVDYNSFNVTAKNIEKAITINTKAIIPVHLFGQGCQMEAIMDIAKKYDLFVIEDNAQAIGADYKFINGKIQKLGTIGHIGCTSFFPSKNLGCYGDGGAIFTNDDQLAQKLRMICNHGMKERYHHEVLGVNSRLDTIQAAILDVKLKYLDQYCKLRYEAATRYSYAFKDIEELVTPSESYFSTHVYHQYTLKVLNGKRDELRKYLQDNGIPAMIYYPIPLHKQEAFLQIAHQNGEMNVSEQLSDEVLSLPMHTELDLGTIAYIISKVLQFFNK
ncbi:MAG: DegT/DnrJ/EryC1/StrS family aminotransferase [Bacteroidales bacterium]|nr:DegT/DnrJ/EryC1/StrS family aminotransferase [Bacteroidales bacterium]MDD4529359.1 DegT/DnrJ/EryC1/StrS family aminotransferase [Bacteroidales bacterium]